MSLKLFLGFKYIRFKVLLKYKSTICKEVHRLRSKFLAEALECSYPTARELVSRNPKILSMDSDEFERNLSFCRKYLRFSDIVEFPILISFNSSVLQHRYFSILELGCTNVSAALILRYPQLLKKSSTELQREGIIFSPDNLEYFNSLLVNTNSEEIRDINRRLSALYRKGFSLLKIKETMNAEALSLKLDSSLYKPHWIFRRCPPLRLQSIKNTFELLDVLFHSYNLSIARILQFSNVLTLQSDVAEQFIDKVPSILGVTTERVVTKMPAILKVSPKCVQQMEDVLLQFGVSSEQLLCCPRVIIFSPKILRQRLELLCQSEELSVMKSYKKFLWLVYYYNNIRPRLEALRSVDIPCSINMFTVSSSVFEKYLCFSECRSHTTDICRYLAGTFQCSEREISDKLSEFSNLRNSSVVNCSRVVDYLLGTGVTKKQLFNGLGVIFYDLDVVKTYFSELKQHPECQPFADWSRHYNLIQLLIYFIEVDSGFKGSRLYKAETRGVTEDFDDSERLAEI